MTSCGHCLDINAHDDISVANKLYENTREIHMHAFFLNCCSVASRVISSNIVLHLYLLNFDCKPTTV
jgi:hypothetical protein